MNLMGGGAMGGATGDLDRLATLAKVFADPDALSRHIADVKGAEHTAIAAQASAQAIIDASVLAQQKLDARKAELDTREAILTESAQNNTSRTAQLDQATADLKTAQAKLDADRQNAADDLARGRGEIATADAALQTRTANANAALNQRAAKLAAREDAVLVREREADERKSALDKRAALFAAAAAASSA